VSTVLRPVGPLPPGVYWRRRALLLLALIVIIIVIAVSCSGGGGGKPTANPNPRPTASTTPTAGPCAPTALKLTLSTDATTYAVGATPTFIGAFTNTSATTCKLTLSPANETWTVTSGPTVWTNAHCQRSQLAHTKTIRPGGSRTVSFQWDGKTLVTTTGCTPGNQAQPGVYTLLATLDGLQASGGAVFHITRTGQ
jgi:hypothetical protein